MRENHIHTGIITVNPLHLQGTILYIYIFLIKKNTTEHGVTKGLQKRKASGAVM